jgi:hypothetical protein
MESPLPTRLIITVLFAMLATPALAQSSIAIPEPSDAALFVIAVVGLIVGRQSSRRRPPADDV